VKAGLDGSNPQVIATGLEAPCGVAVSEPVSGRPGEGRRPH